MYGRVRFYISACFYYSGLIPLIRWWMQRGASSRLTILYYHQASKSNLRSHWLYLRRHYRIRSLEEALEELALPDKQGNAGKDRRPLLALTFDDGYDDNYTHAFPLACELQIPFTIFLIPEYMECNNAFWWATRLIRLAQVEQVTFEEQTYNLESQEERKALAQALGAGFSSCTSPIAQEKFIALLYRALAIPPSIVIKEKPAPLLTWAKVQKMQESGYVSFGAHTLHHPDLALLVDPVEVQHEVGACRLTLEQQLGHPIHSFAYPFGRPGEHGLRAVKQAGYDWAVTTLPGSNTCQSPPHLLRRRNMDGNKHWLVVAAETAGIWGFFSRLKGTFYGRNR
jgi:peptidoglycan/xylan/chitin deacetylase (PgdA/CDA1 family)